MQTSKSQKYRCLRIVEENHHLLCVLLSFCIHSEDIQSPAMLHQIAQYAATLQKIESCLRAQQELGTIRRLFKQSEITARLDSCETELKVALSIFTIGRSSSNASSGSLSILPAYPKIFHGREAELEDLTNILLADTARVAILGPGGMGKTTLAMAALHDSKVVKKYSTCYFVSCDSAHTSDSLVAIIAANLGLEPSRALGRVVIHHLSTGPPCLVVLDNFETPWESVDGRTKVEEFLALLADVPHVALLITMRGAERPSKIQWTHPFLRPLMPLTSIAARQTFIDIADEIHNNTELLDITDNVPLAIQLVATIAASEGCQTTLEQWKLERTALLSAGSDKRSNLEISISLSLSCPRMLSSPHAGELLSLMSLMSDGISDMDLQLFAVQQAQSRFFFFGKFSREQLPRAQFSTVCPKNKLIRFALKIRSECNTGIFDLLT
ncbi:P-loop containing nucleoside triphosphate hydrolase protein [Mycena capillaripes]|nr:P-loop containing nucleoside triphosphate hydrolase protein [Mycena capillaripes]